MICFFILAEICEDPGCPSQFDVRSSVILDPSANQDSSNPDPEVCPLLLPIGEVLARLPLEPLLGVGWQRVIAVRDVPVEDGTVDGRNPVITTWDAKIPVNNGINW